MALSTGTKLGAYEITAPLGAGGMGEVYRAHDPASTVKSPLRFFLHPFAQTLSVCASSSRRHGLQPR
jgi:serine/threonine protein kinase